MAASLIICLCAGFGYAWSVLQGPIITNHGWPAAQVSLAYTITVVCSTMTPLFFAPLIRKLRIRHCIAMGALCFGGGLILAGYMETVWQLYVFYGLLSGLGCGFIYPSLMAYVVRLFPDKAGLASGLGTAAYGSGAIIWAPAAVTLINDLSLDSAFRILGCAFLIVILGSSLLLGEPTSDIEKDTHSSFDGEKHELSSDLCRSQMVRTPTFYLMVMVFTFALVAGTIVISQASPILRETLNFTSPQAAVFVSVFAACNMLGRFLWGGLSDRFGIRKVITTVFVLCILSMTMLSFYTKIIVVVCAMGLAAFCYGGFASVLTPLTALMFGNRYISENYGVMYVVFGIAGLIGPALAVFFKSANGGSYSGAFFVAALLATAGLIGSCFLKPKVNQGELYEK